MTEKKTEKIDSAYVACGACKKPTLSRTRCFVCGFMTCYDCKGFSESVNLESKTDGHRLAMVRDIVICNACGENLKLTDKDRHLSFIAKRMSLAEKKEMTAKLWTKSVSPNDGASGEWEKTPMMKDPELFGTSEFENTCDLCNKIVARWNINPCRSCLRDVCSDCRKFVPQTVSYVCGACIRILPLFIVMNLAEWCKAVLKFGPSHAGRILGRAWEFGVVMKTDKDEWFFDLFDTAAGFRAFLYENESRKEPWYVAYAAKRNGKIVRVGKPIPTRTAFAE